MRVNGEKAKQTSEWKEFTYTKPVIFFNVFCSFHFFIFILKIAKGNAEIGTWEQKGGEVNTAVNLHDIEYIKLLIDALLESRGDWQ